MVKSIAGIAGGPAHASVYTSEGNSPVLKLAICLKKIEAHCNEGDWGDKLKETNRDKGQNHWDGRRRKCVSQWVVFVWLKTIMEAFLLKASLNQAWRMQQRNTPPSWSTCKIQLQSQFLSCFTLITVFFLHLPLALSLGASSLAGLQLFVCSLRNRLGTWKEKQGEDRSKPANLRRGFSLPVEPVAVTSH